MRVAMRHWIPAAALFVLAAMTILLWTAVDRVLRRLLYWAPETTTIA